MFALTADDLQRRVLGCGDGPASFNSALTKWGGSAMSVDPLYVFSAAQIAARIQATSADVLQQMYENKHDYVWTRMGSVEALGQLRLAVMQAFLADYDPGRKAGRYVVGALPARPFADRQFDLALCSHFLFLYSTHLSLAFHRSAATEMCRVATEVRIYPLLNLDRAPSPHVEVVMAELQCHGYHVSIEEVPYEFQRGSKKMMRVMAG